MMKTGDPGGRRAMTVGAMLVLVGVLVVYLMLGLWAVTQIFPRDPASPSRPTPTGGSSGTVREKGTSPDRRRSHREVNDHEREGRCVGGAETRSLAEDRARRRIGAHLGSSGSSTRC